LETDQEVDVGEAPGPPADPAGELDPAEIDDGRRAPDGGDVARMAVAEHRWRVTPQSRCNGPRRMPAALFGGVADAGYRLAVRPDDGDGVADGKDVGAIRHGEVGLDLDPSRAVGLDAEPSGSRRGQHPCRPDDGLGLGGGLAIRDGAG